MELRIHFTAQDLVRTRVASGLDHMWEVAASLQLLHNQEAPLVFDSWRRWTRRRVAATGLGREVELLTTIDPHAAYFPDFLTPATHSGDLESGIDNLLATPTRRIHTELERLGGAQRLPYWTRRLAAGEPRVLRGLGDALRRFHKAVLEPTLDHLRRRIDGHRTDLAQARRAGGVESVLRSLGPNTRWEAPVLRVRYPHDRDVYLEGRGLLLVPSFFTWGRPVSLADPSLAPVLVYPIRHQPDWLECSHHPAYASVAALIGHTRTNILAGAIEGATTTELARRLGIAPATVSHHTTVLREAGLIASRRCANTVVHTTSTLGTALLQPKS